MKPLAGYDVCKSFIAVHSPDGSQTNYQMKLTIIRGAGVSSAGTLYLDNKSTNWPNDIRFTKVDGVTLLDFWREESDATDGTWWIEVDSIPDPDDFTGYVHIGDADAADASNGDNTFLFHDHFPGEALDTTTKWVVENGTPTVASSICTLKEEGGVHEIIYTKPTDFPTNRAMRVCLKSKHFDVGTYYESIEWTDAVHIGHVLHFAHPTGGYQGTVRTYDGGEGVVYDITNWVADTYSIVDIIRNGSTNVKWIFGDTEVFTSTTHLADTYSGHLRYIAYAANNAELDIDWILVRVCTLNPPTWGAWGEWETDGGGAAPTRNKLLSFSREPLKRMVFHKR